MKSFFQDLLASLSRAIISKHHPIVIGITGSVGKTSTKEAVFDMVSQKYRTRKSEKNFNNEIGLPLTIIGVNDAPGRNPGKWLNILYQALSLVLFKQRYPEVLILEMGIDRVGDMEHLLSIARPHIAIITTIGVSHYEFMNDLATTSLEKGKIAEILKAEDFLILNADNEEALKQKNKTSGKTLTFGVKEIADVRLVNIQEKLENNFFTAFTVQTPNRKFETFAKILGDSHLSAIAAACAVAEALNIEVDLAIKGVQEYKAAPGRLNLIGGIKHSVIIDDSYNAAPDSTKTALRLLAKIPNGCKIAVLGDMLELGSVSDSAHEEIGKLAAALRLNELITVGPSGKIIAQSAKNAGMDEQHILSFDTSDEAKKTVQELLRPSSLILIKGSQGVRMEKITKEIMAEPMRAPELLCRQYGKWLNN
jgi:UDP-N-acetylmuramoyl-tripeptide--D-alanyl-D-alanine ligase